MFVCSVCNKAFTTRGSLNRHYSTSHDSRSFTCPNCQKSFTRKYALTNHQKNQCVRKRKLIYNEGSGPGTEPVRKRMARIVPTQESTTPELFKFDINDYDPDVRETINANQQLILPFAKTNRKIMDTYNIPIVGYDTDKITALMKQIYMSQRFSYKVCFFLLVFIKLKRKHWASHLCPSYSSTKHSIYTKLPVWFSRSTLALDTSWRRSTKTSNNTCMPVGIQESLVMCEQSHRIKTCKTSSMKFTTQTLKKFCYWTGTLEEFQLFTDALMSTMSFSQHFVRMLLAVLRLTPTTTLHVDSNQKTLFCVSPVLSYNEVLAYINTGVMLAVSDP